MVCCVDEDCSEDVSSIARGLAVRLSAYLTGGFTAGPDKENVRISTEGKRIGEQGIAKELIGESGSQGESERTHRRELGICLEKGWDGK